MNRDSKNPHETLSYGYKFIFDDGTAREFNLKLEKDTLELIEPPDETYPDWALLSNEKCTICPFEEKDRTYCPVAVSISDLIEFVGNYDSFEEVDVEVTSERRIIKTHTTLQRGVASCLGLFMTTSGCPILAKLKPMARYHLPFASLRENSYRLISMYLLSQYFLFKNGQTPDWELKNMKLIFEDVHTVNKCFFKRLSNLKLLDAGVNALLLLDNSGTHIHFQIDEDQLSEIQLLCDKYIYYPSKLRREHR